MKPYKSIIKHTVILAMMGLLFINPVIAQDWYNSEWNYRRDITIDNPGGVVLTDFQVRIVLDESFDFSKANSNGSDIRITASDGLTLLPYWIELWNNDDSQAIIWVKVPAISTSGTDIFIYYGNNSATDEADGDSTFEFFDDFESSITTQYGYFDFSQTPITILNGAQAWESSAPHTHSVVELNLDGYKYWGYYSLQQYPEGGPIGLARSNNLKDWTKYESNPVLNGQKRWASAIPIGSSLYIGYTEYTGVSSIVLAVSQLGPDFGIVFTDVKILVPEEPGFYNGSPNFFLNPNDGLYYMYYVRINTSTNYRDIMVRCAANIEDLDTATASIVLSSEITFSAPNMMYDDGIYYLGVETIPNGSWHIEIWASSSPTSGFAPLPGNPIISDGAACLFQHIYNDTLHLYYANQTGGTWTMEYRTAAIADGKLEFQGPDSVDSTKWTPYSGSWITTIDTQQDGDEGVVVQGSTTGIQTLQSKGFTGTDYIVEAYGRQLSGPEWGLCSRSTGPYNFYVCNLYDNHDDTDNLYNYNWMPATHPVIAKTALGTINTNQWYKMTVKVYDDTISTSIDGIEYLKVQDSQHTEGGIALFGENGTEAQFNDVRVRKFTDIEPTTNIGDEENIFYNIGIAVYNNDCGNFEVRLKPSLELLNSTLSNVQFTLKWPTNTVNLINFYSDFGLTQQGPVFIENDTNYIIFVSATPIPINWIADTEYTILSFAHDQSGTGYTDFSIDIGNWSATNNAAYYVEILGTNQTGDVYQNATNTYLGTCGKLDIKVLLEGPYNTTTGFMNTILNAAGELPMVQPYSGLPWFYTGSENVAIMPADVVDWVLVELRDAPDAASATTATRINEQAALLLNDGSIVGVDGSPLLEFNNSTTQNLFIVIWHRNHLGIMTAVDVIPSPANYYNYDFTTAVTQAFGDGQNQLGSSIFGLTGGDANADGTINLSDAIQVWIPQAGTSGYLNGDLDLDGQVNNPDKNELWFKNFNDYTHVPD